MSSSVLLYRLGMYWSDEETPRAPSRMAWSTSASMRRSSSGVAGRLASPTTMRRAVPVPMKVPRLMAEPRRSKVLK